MNLQHLKYIVEVERVGSITKAAANLFMGQPNLSKAIKELEEEIGITVFIRSARGVFPTEKGAEFLSYAKTILVQMEKIEALYRPETAGRVSFSISVTGAPYITRAFGEFIGKIDGNKHIEADFRETNAVGVIQSIISSESSLGIIRCCLDSEEYFKRLFEEKKLRSELLRTAQAVLLVPEDSPLAAAGEISPADLKSYTEIIRGDIEVPYLSRSYTERESLSGRVIRVYDEGSIYSLLKNIPRSFTEAPEALQGELSRTGLAECRCKGPEREYADMLVCPASYKFTETDMLFMECIHKELSGETGKKLSLTEKPI